MKALGTIPVLACCFFDMKTKTMFPFIILHYYFLGSASSSASTVFSSSGGLSPLLVNGDVSAYLGVPYAAPLSPSLRFKHPRPPVAWEGVRRMDKMPPVCPQVLPDLKDAETRRIMTKKRLKFMENILPTLQRQSEDCLYLNIYVPNTMSGETLPVVVFIHGESYEWNAGNAYNPSVFAAESNTIVVTLNYRLGILGFFRPSFSDQQIGNFGLLDQIAALQWLQDNLAHFNGNAKNVTLMGHGTGAMLVNFLVSSPIVRHLKKTEFELFQQVILLGGSAHSSLAMVKNPSDVTKQVLEQSNCIDESNYGHCLQQLSISQLLKIKVDMSPFNIPFGPMVDNIVIKDTEEDEPFDNYHVLAGLTQMDSIYIVPGTFFDNGIEKQDFEKIVEELLHYGFGIDSEMKKEEIISYYKRTNLNDKEESFRNLDCLLNILNDALVVAPMIKTVNQFQTSISQQTYLYMLNFTAHKSRSVFGDDIRYLFETSFDNTETIHLSNEDIILSQKLKDCVSSFIKTGNPMMLVDKYGKSAWTTFKHKAYMSLGLQPSMKNLSDLSSLTLWDSVFVKRNESTYVHQVKSTKVAECPVHVSESSVALLLIVAVVILLNATFFIRYFKHYKRLKEWEDDLTNQLSFLAEQGIYLRPPGGVPSIPVLPRRGPDTLIMEKQETRRTSLSDPIIEMVPIQDYENITLRRVGDKTPSGSVSEFKGMLGYSTEMYSDDTE